MQSSLFRQIWCCQIRITCQPSERSFRKLRWSRSRFDRSLFCQNGVSLRSQTGSRQPCQKSPSTKTATYSLGKTMSGRPGSLRAWQRKRTPFARSSRCTTCSSEPFFSLTRFIARERCWGVRWSAIVCGLASRATHHLFGFG